MKERQKIRYPLIPTVIYAIIIVLLTTLSILSCYDEVSPEEIGACYAQNIPIFGVIIQVALARWAYRKELEKKRYGKVWYCLILMFTFMIIPYLIYKAVKK